MKMIDKIIEQIEEELEGAKEYAERYIESKARGNTNRANIYREMANDELRHAANIHEFAMRDVADIEKVYTMSQEESDKWQHCTNRYSHCMAMIKMMLN